MPSQETPPAAGKIRRITGRQTAAKPMTKAAATKPAPAPDAALARVAAIRTLRRELRSLAAQIRSGEPIPPHSV